MTTLLPAYLLLGDDELKQAEAKKRLENYIDESAKAFDYSYFDAQEQIPVEELLSALNSFPLIGNNRLVFIANGERLEKDISTALEKYLSEPLETTILALQTRKLAKNTRLYKAFKQIGEKAIVVSESKKRWELPNYAKKIALSYGIELTSEAAQELVSRLGESTLLLDSEIKKLSLMFSNTKKIDIDIVSREVSRVAEVKPWDITDAMCKRDISRVLELFSLMENQSLLGLLSLCTMRIRELLVAKSLSDRGQGHLLASELNMQAWQVKHHMQWQKNFTSVELSKALSSAADLELQLKSSVNKEEAFIVWLSDFCAK